MDKLLDIWYEVLRLTTEEYENWDVRTQAERQGGPSLSLSLLVPRFPYLFPPDFLLCFYVFLNAVPEREGEIRSHAGSSSHAGSAHT